LWGLKPRDRTQGKHTRPGNWVSRIPAQKFREIEVVHPVFTTILLQLNYLLVWSDPFSCNFVLKMRRITGESSL
jgi:hypothetical protein